MPCCDWMYGEYSMYNDQVTGYSNLVLFSFLMDVDGNPASDSIEKAATPHVLFNVSSCHRYHSIKMMAFGFSTFQRKSSAMFQIPTNNGWS
jgi:hypothetical protein